MPVVHANPVQHPLADLENEVRLLRERNELRRRNVAVSGQPPAQQRFGADDAAVAQVDLRLVLDDELVALQRAAQLALQHEPLDGGGIHLGRVEREGVAAVLLRVVHRRIRVADEVDDVLGVARAQRYADARRQKDFVLVELERAAHFREDGAREMGDRAAVVGIRGQSVHEQRELIAGEPADDGVFRQ